MANRKTAKRIFLLSTGTSLYGNLKAATSPGSSSQTGALAAASNFAASLSIPLDNLLRHIPAPYGPNTGGPVDVDDLAVEGTAWFEEMGTPRRSSRFDYPILAALSAEIQTLFAHGAPTPNPRSDRLVLACSDTYGGARCALGVSWLLGGTVRLGTVDEWVAEAMYDTGPGSHIKGYRVDVLVIPGLDVQRPSQFTTAAVGLAKALGTAQKRARRELILHITGGYKVTIPLLLQLAGHLPLAGADVSVWGTHDATPEAIRIPVQRIGVPGLLAAALAAVAQGNPPPNHIWEGYAYQEVRRGWSLTPVGTALIELT